MNYKKIWGIIVGIIKNLMINFIDPIQTSFIKVLREFGVVGLITYIGGLVILRGFLREENLNRQIVIGIVGVFLLFLSAAIAHFRIKIQRDREQALIDMVKNTGNRLAEQVAKNLSNEQVVSITQTIWQNQKDLIVEILNNDEKKNK